MSNTRRWPRMALALDVKVRLEHVDHAVEGRTVNLSREGVFIAIDPPKPIGTRVRVALQIASSGEKFTMEGVVVRCVPEGEDELKPGETPGIAVFLTMTSAGYGRFLDDLLVRREAVTEFEEASTQKTSGAVVEAVRKPR